MFDTEFGHLTDTDLASAIDRWSREEACAAARRTAAIAELVHRRCEGDERAHWACDEWDSAAAEISAALGISRGRASGQMHLAVTLRTRLPRVAALYLRGRLSTRVVTAIAWRTDLVQDPEALALIDAAVADHAGDWDVLSQYKLDQAVDVWIDRHDPGALRRTRAGVRGRDVSIGGQNPETGTTALWGRLLGTDAAVLDRRLTQMAHQVCDDDPRTIGQRRADALGVLGAGGQRLACECGVAECSGSGPDARAGSVVIHVLADADAVAAQPDPHMSGDGPAPEPVAQPGSAALVGGAAVPTPLLAALIRSGATVRLLRRPPEAPEPQYRPSAALEAFVRMRDLTCRFPGCDVPAQSCDIDHAAPWPCGPTHAANCRLLCRKHHLLKTFWVGEGGWSDAQFPDGTIVWTSPSGKTYTTRPGSRLLFPDWDDTTVAIRTTGRPDATGRSLMMPVRRRTRAAARAYRIRRERALNDARIAERNKPPPF